MPQKYQDVFVCIPVYLSKAIRTQDEIIETSPMLLLCSTVIKWPKVLEGEQFERTIQ